MDTFSSLIALEIPSVGKEKMWPPPRSLRVCLHCVALCWSDCEFSYISFTTIVFSGFSGVEQTVVYGVPIPGLEGKAGMASFQPTEGNLSFFPPQIILKETDNPFLYLIVDSFDFDGLYAYLNKQLAAYANPLFLRVQTNVETTTTFKYTKVGLVEDGYDPKKIKDALYFRSVDEGKYIPLDEELFEKINAGKVRV